MEGNGHNDNESRLDRLEDAWNLVIQDHEEFRREHKMLLAAQVVMHDEQFKLEKSLDRLTGKVDQIGDKLNGLIAFSNTVHRENEALSRDLGEKFGRLIDWSVRTQPENEQRFRRLEEKR
jgi:hypothetical protein